MLFTLCSPFSRYLHISTIACVLLACTAVRADLVDTFQVGEGSATAEIQFDFSNGNSYLYILQWEGNLTGRDVFDAILQDQPGYFDFTIQQYDWGDFLTGIQIGDDTDSGDGSTPPYLNYWHYWTAETTNPWEMSMIGFSDRILLDGSRDAWVFGSDAMPATIPAPAAGVVLCTLRSRRRRRN